MSDFESRHQLNTEELEAVAKAIEIISSGADSGNANKYLPTLVQKQSLLSLRADDQSQTQSHAAAYLKAMATQLNSRMLLAVADHAAVDPFKKEANEKAEHNG